MTSQDKPFQIFNDTIEAELWYPRNSHIKFVEVDLIDVRAADSIRISYDFDRDGWKIEQASKFSWNLDEPYDQDWQEVSFVQAWGRKETGEQEAERLGWTKNGST